jgi:hypothetical protein
MNSEYAKVDYPTLIKMTPIVIITAAQTNAFFNDFNNTKTPTFSSRKESIEIT